MFSLRKIGLIVPLCSLIFGYVIVIPNINEQLATAQTRTQKNKTVGKVECSGLGQDSYQNTRQISLATIEPTRQGYKLRIVEIPRSETIMQLNNNLVVIEAGSLLEDGTYGNWNLVSYNASKNPFEIKPNGSFSQTMMVSTRSGCTFEGKIQFLNGADKKLFGSQGTNRKYMK